MKKVKKTSHVPSGFYSKGIIKSNDQFHDYPRLAFLRDTYAALMDEVITAMAGQYALWSRNQKSFVVQIMFR